MFNNDFLESFTNVLKTCIFRILRARKPWVFLKHHKCKYGFQEKKITIILYNFFFHYLLILGFALKISIWNIGKCFNYGQIFSYIVKIKCQKVRYWHVFVNMQRKKIGADFWLWIMCLIFFSGIKYIVINVSR